jgi:hypothetical protein
MHDLNDALDDLRSVIPYAHGPSVRKLSKIATLLLAKNFIMMQSNIIDELKKELHFLLTNHSNLSLSQVQCSVANINAMTSSSKFEMLEQLNQSANSLSNDPLNLSTTSSVSNSTSPKFFYNKQFDYVETGGNSD